MDPNDRKYTNGEITVHWRPKDCIHATTCYRELIEVFNPRKRPWIDMKGASTGKIIEIVKKCPTQALTYDWNDPDKISEKPGEAAVMKNEEGKIRKSKDKPVEIRVMKSGPYVIKGDFRIIDSNGVEQKPRLVASLCRCGASGDLPYCDGSHRIKNIISDDCD